MESADIQENKGLPNMTAEDDPSQPIDAGRPIIRTEDQTAWLANLDAPCRRPSLAYIMGLIITTGFAWVVYLLMPSGSERHIFIPLLICLAVVLALWWFRKQFEAAPRNWYSPDTVFLGVFCVFHFAYIFFYTIGIAPYDPEVFYAEDKVGKAIFFCMGCLAVFLIGYDLAGGFFRQRTYAPQISPGSPTLNFISKMIILLSVVFFWTVLFFAGLGALITNYSALIRIGTGTGGRFFWVAQNLAAVGLAMYCASSGLLYGKFMSGKVFPWVACGFVVGILLLGDRGNFIYLAIIPVLAFHYLQRRIKLRWAVLGLLGLFFVMGVIGIARKVVTLNVFQMAQAYKQREYTEHGTIVNSFIEFGVSIKTVVIAMDLVPERHPYWYGKSYLDSLELIVPNVIPGRVRTSQSVGAWLTETAFGSLYETWGRGGSIAMEAYMNFGVLGGIFSFLLLGGGYRVLYELFLTRPCFLTTTVLLAAMSGLIIWTRNTSSMYTRTVVWAVITAWIIQMLCRNERTTENLPVEEEVEGYLPDTYEYK
jgi:oligosaccharide repeat unit polymerase